MKRIQHMNVTVTGSIKAVNVFTNKQDVFEVSLELQVPEVHRLPQVATALWGKILEEFTKNTTGYCWKETDLYIGALKADLSWKNGSATVKPPLSEEAWVLDGFYWKPLKARTMIGKGRF